MPASGRVLVTGATGFVGAAIVRACLRAGYEVRAVARAQSLRGNLHGIDIEVVEGDIRDASAVERAMRGCRYAIHAAADYRLWVRNPAELVGSNVDGTRNIVDAALACGIDRLVYTSSVATLVVDHHGKDSDESRPIEERHAIGPYKKSKVAAERVVATAVETKALPAVVVLPSTPIGPRDIKPTPTGRVIVEAAAGRMPGYVDTGLNLVHVDDVAEGHIAALERGQLGERYILGGQNVLLADMLREIARLAGRKPPRLRLPRRALYPLAAGAELAAAFTGREPFVTISGLRMARHRMFFSSAKAQRELGFRARPYPQALEDAIDWFRSAGYLQ